LVLAGGLFAVGQVLATLPLAGLQSRALMAPKIITAVLGVAGNLFGAYVFGLAGVAVTETAFSALYCGWLFVIVSRQRRSA
jgi:hypothetical protein